MTYKIGSFNCLNFGRAAEKDVQIFADIILNESFDIIALQEIKGQNALNRILSRLPSYWVGKADNDPVSNDYAFVWNSRRFSLADAKETGKSKVFTPHIYKQYKIDRKSGQKDLIREPFYARFFPCGGAAPYLEIRLINAHIRYSKGSSEGNNEGAVKMRKNEFDILTKSIYTKVADKRYGNNRPAYTFLLGDYNLNMPLLHPPYLIESFEIIDGQNIKIITTVQRQRTTLKNLSTSEDESDDYFANNYDHFTFDANRFRDTVISSRAVDTVEKYCNSDFKKYKKDVSDHIPVILDFNI